MIEYKAIKISHDAGGRSMKAHRMLMLVLMTAAVCVMSAGIGTADDVNLTLKPSN